MSGDRPLDGEGKQKKAFELSRDGRLPFGGEGIQVKVKGLRQDQGCGLWEF